MPCLGFWPGLAFHASGICTIHPHVPSVSAARGEGHRRGSKRKCYWWEGDTWNDAARAENRSPSMGGNTCSCIAYPNAHRLSSCNAPSGVWEARRVVAYQRISGRGRGEQCRRQYRRSTHHHQHLPQLPPRQHGAHLGVTRLPSHHLLPTPLHRTLRAATPRHASVIHGSLAPPRYRHEKSVVTGRTRGGGGTDLRGATSLQQAVCVRLTAPWLASMLVEEEREASMVSENLLC